MIEYKNLSYEEKKELLRLLECDGIKINKNQYSDKRQLFDSLWGNSICIEPLRKSIMELVDVLTNNFEEKVSNSNHRETKTYRRRKTVPEEIKDEYEKITKSLIEAITPYWEKATDEWRGYEIIVEKGKCKDCAYRKPFGEDSFICTNEKSCYYTRNVKDNFVCKYFSK